MQILTEKKSKCKKKNPISRSNQVKEYEGWSINGSYRNCILAEKLNKFLSHQLGIKIDNWIFKMGAG